MDDARPTPEQMLVRAEAEATPERGRLKIFFGAAPGVGKTYGMLETARAKEREGVEVVIGWVETHGRAETDGLTRGYERIPPKKVVYRGIELSDFDLDAALARRPRLLLVDELAHTNAPGLRHAKRWQDVQELLDAGIDVYSTLNVQHVESLNDVVAEITGVVVKETVPDSILERADEIELMDLSPEDLLQRLNEGKVYVPTQAKRAIESFFQKGNLIALRELALRRTAEHVDADVAAWKRAHGVRVAWPTRERILVAVGPGAQSANLIRTAFRMASTARAPWIALSVETPALEVLPVEARSVVAEHFELAERLGAETLVVHGERIVDEILAAARERNVTRIVVGKPTKVRWQDRIGRSIVGELVRRSGPIDVLITTGEDSPEPRAPKRRERGFARPRDYGVAAGLVLIATAISALLRSRLDFADVVLIHLLATVVGASRLSRGPTLLGAVTAVALLGFVFLPGTFSISEIRYSVAFAAIAVMALFVSGRTIRLRDQAEVARQRERRTAALSAMSKDLLVQTEVEQIAATAIRHAQDLLQTEATLMLPDAHGELVPKSADEALMTAERELAVARWVFEHSRPAGHGTDTLPACNALFLPMIGTRVLGVFGVALAERGAPMTPLEAQLLEALVAQTGLALERALFSEEATGARVTAEAQRLRSALVGAVSHDLRPPLASIRSAAVQLMTDPVIDAADRTRILAEISDGADRLTELVGDLLELGRLESGIVELHKEWTPLERLVRSALSKLERELVSHKVALDLPNEIEASVDPELLHEALVQILENAAKYTPPETAIEIRARGKRDEIEIEISDRGPGLPPGNEQLVFQRFYRGAEQTGTPGTGLGLSICQAIVLAHGGSIQAANRADGGARFTMRLPPNGVGHSIEAQGRRMRPRP